MRNIIFLSLIVFVVGCATGPRSKKGPSPYSASWIGQDVEHEGSKECPADNGFTKLAWKPLVSLAAQCVRAKNFSQVERVASHLAKIEPEAPWGSYFLSLAAEHRNDMPRAYWMIELALKKAPEDGILLYQRSRLHWSEKNHDLAIKDLEQSIRYNPSIADAHVQMGQIQFTLGEHGSAVGSFQRAVQLDSSKEQAWFGLGEAQFAKKNYEEAYAQYQRSARLNPKNGMALLRMAQIQEIHYKNIDRSLGMYKTLQREVSLNRVEMAQGPDLGEKIRALETASKQALAPTGDKAQASKREPSSKKVSK